MTTPSTRTHQIDRFPETLAVVRLPAGAEIPTWAESSSIFSITATSTETSLVCAARGVPRKSVHHGPLTGFAVKGPLDLALVGVLHELLGPLVQEQISVFTLSTYDTDWILVAKDDADSAADAWRRHGHEVAPAVPATGGKTS